MKDIKIHFCFTTRFGRCNHFGKITTITFCIILLNALHFFAQDLKDHEHTIKFADYLFKTEQFTLASEEYERAVFTKQNDNNIKLRLLQSYRFSNKYDIAINRLEHFFKDSIYNVHQNFAEEYVKNLILTKNNKLAYDYLENNISLRDGTRHTYQLGCLLLEKNWDNAFNFALKSPVTKDKKNADLHVLAFRTKQLKYKKPFNAALFSAIIPGTGKMYTKNWKDGLISLIFVGVNTWQAYRGFNADGVESVYGWVFAGFATSFYFSNIFGSYRSAKKYNRKIDDGIYHEAWHLVVDDF